MKKALPPYAKLSKESKECIQECVSEFISFTTSQAADKCRLENRKTINGEDILWSMHTLGFEHYAETLKILLAKYREFEQIEAELRPPRRKIVKQPIGEIESGEDNFKLILVMPEEEDDYDEVYDDKNNNNMKGKPAPVSELNWDRNLTHYEGSPYPFTLDVVDDLGDVHHQSHNNPNVEK